MADAARLVHRQLGRERPRADARGVGLGDAEDVVQHVGPDARAGGGVAGHAVARRDVRIGAVVDVEQGALSALEQRVLAAQVRLVQQVADVGHHRRDAVGQPHRLLEHRFRVERPGAQVAFEHDVVQLDQLAELLLEALGMLEVLHAQRAARDLVLVGRTDPLAGGADAAGAALLAQRLAGAVELDVQRQDQRARLAHEQPRAHLDADRLQALDLGQQVRRIDHHAVADVALHAVAHDARGDELQRRLHALDDQRVAGVVAALEAHHVAGVVGQPVDHLALALVAPLRADDDDVAARAAGGRGGRIGKARFAHGVHCPGRKGGLGVGKAGAAVSARARPTRRARRRAGDRR